MFSYEPGLDIGASRDDVLVNTVNCVGVMGAGVAKAIRDAYPSVMDPYRRACNSGRLAPGTLHIHRVEGGPMIINMATKQHWRNPSRIDWVGSGLLYLSHFLQQELDRRPGSIASVTLPPPGCGHGGLDWGEVHGLAKAMLAPVTARGVSIRFTIHRPDAIGWPMVYAGVGSRETPEEVLQVMRELGGLLAGRGFHLRSGGAIGADTAFEEGARSAGGEMSIYLARPDARKPHGKSRISDMFPRLMRNFHPKPDALSAYPRLLMERNGAQVFGEDFSRPCDLVICWTPGGRAGGGTGQAIRLARAVGIPVLDLGDPSLDGWGPDALLDRALELALERRTVVQGEGLEAVGIGEMLCNN